MITKKRADKIVKRTMAVTRNITSDDSDDSNDEDQSLMAKNESDSMKTFFL